MLSNTVIIESAALKLPVLAVAKGGLVVDKPAGVSVHNDKGCDLCSLVAATIRENRRIMTAAHPDPDFGVHPVHRLDKETSGIMLLAVDRAMFRFYSRQFETGQAVKEYVALLHGRLEGPSTGGAWALWQRPLAKAAGGRNDPAGAGKRLPSKTDYRVLGYSGHYTLAAVRLHTGRTHQIRRHAKLAGHPVVGDARYGSKRAVRFLKTTCHFERLALHARSLTLCMAPGEGPQTIETAGVPEAIMTLFETDRVAIRPVDPRVPEIRSMIADLDAYQAALYPPESNHLVAVTKLAGPEYCFLAAFEGERPLAIAAFKRVDRDYVEIKRLYVSGEHRGRGLALTLVKALEEKAKQEGFGEARLETGIRQHAAIALYEKLGYDRTGPFGNYQEDPLSVFMRKKL